MRILAIIAGILLGLLFLFASLAYFFKLVDAPPPPAGSPAAQFMGVFYPTHYLDFVKVCELLGGILVAVPATRRLGLLFLGPIILNILAFHTFITKGEGLGNPMLLLIVALALFLIWVDRKVWAAFLRGRAA
jgi:uncharacterized membrane protein YphA (DoxX/SURF4 family)